MDEAVGREIHALNKEMIAAGVRKFACGLGAAKSLRRQTDGKVLVTDGPYLETKEHIGGFFLFLFCTKYDTGGTGAKNGAAPLGVGGAGGKFVLTPPPLPTTHRP